MKEIVDNLSIFIFRGVETSKNFTLNCIQFLARHPEIQAKLRAENKKDIFSTGDESYDTYMDADFLELFVTEGLRTFGPGWTTIFHTVTKNFKIGDYKIFKGTGVMVSFYTLFKKPEYFENPHEVRFEEVRG